MRYGAYLAFSVVEHLITTDSLSQSLWWVTIMDNIYVAHGSETTPEIMHNGETFFVMKFTGEGYGC